MPTGTRSSAERVNAERLRADITALGRFGATDRGGVNRTVYSDADLAARAWLADRCTEAGLGFRTDAIGNCFITLPGSDPDRARVWTGSHIDTVPDGGRLDGAFGVLAGLECLRTLAVADDFRPSATIEVVAFADEEGAYASFVGSRALVDGWTVEALSSLTGRDGEPIAAGLARIGSSIEAAAAVPTIAAAPNAEHGAVAAFVELHIEQGPVLENAGLDIGVVTDIVEVGHGTVTFLGQADHAGTTPMDLRRDATRAAGAFLVGLPSVPAEHGSPAAVATCGMVSVEPGAANIVVEEMRLSLDVRDRAGGVPSLQDGVADLARRCSADHGLEHRLEWGSVTPGVALDPGMQQRVADAADRVGASHHRMVSGAGHDAQVMARAVPTGMIFVPSENGRSHSPAESTSLAQLEVGANVLLEVLRDLTS